MQATQDQPEQIAAPTEEVQLKKEEAAEETVQAESTTREGSSEGEIETNKEETNKEETNQEPTNEESNKEEANKEEANNEEAVKEEAPAAEPVQAEPLSHHAIAINEAVRLFDELIPVEKWEFYGETNGIKTYTRLDVASGLKMARGDGCILKPVEAIEKHVLDVDSVPKWAGNLQSHQIVEQNDYTVYRSLNAKVMFVSQRETIVATKIIKREDGSSLVVQRTTTHADYPENNNFVRAQVNLFAWLLTPNQEDANKTNVTSIIFVDPKGWVPIPVFNAFIHDQAQSVKKLKDFVEKL